MFTSEEKELLEILIINDLQKHAINKDKLISMTSPDTEYTLSTEGLKLRKDILVKLSGMTNTLNRITTRIPASFNYPWCPQILELNERHIKNIAEYIKKGQKIIAIKTLRECSGLGLKEAKDFIELFIPTNRFKSLDYNSASVDLIRQWTNQRAKIMHV